MAKSTASLPIGFQSPTSKLALTLEIHIGNFQYGRGIPVRLYPDVPAKLAATKGTAELGESRVEAVAEIVAFNGKTAGLKRPRGTGFIIKPVDDIAFDFDGNPVNPVVHYDADNDELFSDIPFQGAVEVSYNAPYRLIYYVADQRYAIQADGSKLLSAWGYGTLYAFYHGESASLEMTLEESTPSQWMEVYRVVSDKVRDPDGVWEKPPGWDDNPKVGTFPVGDHEIDPDMSSDESWPHEIGDISKIGQISSIWHRYYVPLLDPYKTAGMSFTPKFYLQWASPPAVREDPDGVWRAAFGQVDKAAVLADLQAKYPGIAVRS